MSQSFTFLQIIVLTARQPCTILSEIFADMYLAFGFLGGKEVKEAGIANAGLYDREPYNGHLPCSSIILLTRQNGSPSTGYKSTLLHLEVILGRSQCEIQHYLCILVLNLLCGKLGRKCRKHFSRSSLPFR